MAVVADESLGYNGTLDETGFSKLISAIGAEFAVPEFGDLAVTIGGTGDRAVTVAAGVAVGRAVLDTFSTSTNLTAAAPGAGATRYDTVVIHRDWGTNTTDLRVLTGTSARAVSSARQVGPGVVDDQPIALIRALGGNTAIQEVVDLRTRSNQTLSVAVPEALPPATIARLGQFAFVGGIDIYKCIRSGGVLVWDNLTHPAWVPVPLAGSVGQLIPYSSPFMACKVFNQVFLRGGVWRASGAPLVTPFTSTIIGTMPVGMRPPQVMHGPWVGGSSAANSTGSKMSMTTGGVLNLFGPTESLWVSFDGISYLV